MLFQNRLLIILFFLSNFYLNSEAQFSFSTSSVKTNNNGTYPVRLLTDINTNQQLSQYGGNLNVKTTATGFFHTKLINDCWYIVDPDGYLFFSVGVCSVVKGGGIDLPKSLRDIGTNTLGCWSDETINTSTTNKMAYTPRWNFMQSYKNTSARAKALYNAGIIPVFDPEYITFCDTHAKQLIAAKNDPYILGHFSDNELTIYDNTTFGNLIDRFLGISDKTDPNYLAAYDWIVARQGTNYSISSTDRELFHGYLLGTYYRITGEAIKRYDPNHMYLGSRLHGAAKDKPSIFIEGGKYVDMISINVYGTWVPTTADMNRWSAGGAPFFVSEFYTKAVDSGMPNTDGAGWLVATQTDRAKFHENFTLALIEHPGCVGFHHFKYIDDDGANKGLVSLDFVWYDTFKASFNKIGSNVYALREFLTGKSTSIKNTNQNLSMQVFPNPSKGQFIIDSSDKTHSMAVEIYSSLGIKIQQTSNIYPPYSINLQKYPVGIYFINATQGDNLMKEQIIKSN